MTREEKEKAYDEALKVVKDNLAALNEITETGAETVNIQSIKNCFYKAFPELKESEDSEDERIRKAIVELVKRTPSSMFDVDTEFNWIGASHDEILAYLEKQKEQKPVEWSEEDERIRKDLIKYLESDRDCQPCQDVSFYDSSIAWLEKQKECGEANFREGYLHGFEDAQKEQKPITINQDEKEFLADEITTFLCNYDKEFDGEDPVPSEIAEHFYLLGKQAQEQKPEQKPEAKLTGWVARDREFNPYYGTGLIIFREKPKRSGDCWSGTITSQLPWNLFPTLKWEDEPIEVEVTIRKK